MARLFQCLSLWIYMLFFFQFSLGTIERTGSTVYLDDIAYFVQPDEVGVLDVDRSGLRGLGLRPVTVLNSNDHKDDSIAIELSKATKNDDIWHSGFLEILIAQRSKTSDKRDNIRRLSILARNTNLGGENSTLISHPYMGLENGPYFMETSTGKMYRGCRLFSDFEGAFLETLVQDKKGKFSVLPANVPGQNLAVCVPSRMYFTTTKEKPLNGVRIGIKDIYDIQDVHTSNGNRAWYHFYPPAKTTAPAVQRLVDAGAVILGKMKTSQFANGETATEDWVDYHEPFNPRGDGYQDTSSSSSGPGAGVGAYPWLDIALGSDTGGSIRGPSEVQGLFGNRPSHGMVSLKDVMPLAPQLDTAGFLCRDPKLWAKAANVLYGGLDMHYPSYPKEILLLSYPKEGAKDAAKANLVSFANKLGAFISAKTKHYNIAVDFKKHTPKDSPTDDINELLSTTYPILISQEQVKLVRDPFYADYKAKHHGRLPFVDPAPLVRWAYGDSFPASALDDALKNKTIFAKWFNSHVLGPDPKSCSDKLLLYVGSEGNTVYRNVYRTAPTPPIGFSAGRISSFSGAPDYVLPVGQSSYNSTITNHTEVLPDTVDIMAARHCDGMLFKLINEMAAAGIIDASVTGRSLLHGKDILFRRAA